MTRKSHNPAHTSCLLYPTHDLQGKFHHCPFWTPFINSGSPPDENHI